MTEWKVGQPLTYEQVMSLPDGAVVSADWASLVIGGNRWTFTTPVADSTQAKHQSGIEMNVRYLKNKDRWNENGWHNTLLESLPEPKPETGQQPQRQASEMEKRAASYYASSMFETFQKTCNNLTWGATIEERDARIKRVEDSILSYREAYDYAKSIGAIETLKHSNTKTQGE